MAGKRLTERVASGEGTEPPEPADKPTAVGICVIQDGIVRQANANAARMFGFSRPVEMIDHVSCHDLVAAEDRDRVSERLRRIQEDVNDDDRGYRFTGMMRDGRQLTVEMHGSPVEHRGRPAVVGVLLDVSRRSRLELEMERRDSYDALTGLPGRTLMFDRINQAIAHSRRMDELFALLFLDLDGFKTVNDHLGHDAGDRVLRIIAERFTGTLRASDTLARLGGDEFAVLASGLLFGDDVVPVAQKLCDVLSSPISLAGKKVRIGVSIGIAIFPAAADDADSLLRAAEAAMCQAKQLRRGSYFFSVPADTGEAEDSASGGKDAESV